MDNIDFWSAFFGLVGAILVFCYGFPPRIDPEGRGFILLEGEDKNEKKKAKRYRKISYLGLFFIVVSFGLQLWSVIFVDATPKGFTLPIDSAWIQAIMAVLLVFITAYYAFQTRETVKTMKEIEDSKNRPRMLIYLEQKKESLNLVDLVIMNVGLDVAYNVSFELKDDLDLDKGEKISQIPFLQNGIHMFFPGRIVRRYLVSLVGNLERLQESDACITVRYTDVSGRRNFEETFHLDFLGLLDRQVGSSPVSDISQSLKEISSSLKRIERDKKK